MMFFLGLLSLSVGGPLAWFAWRRLRLWDRASGTVIGIHEESGESGKVFYPIIRYVDATRNARMMRSDSGARSLAKIKLGVEVLIAINPQDDSMTATVATLKTFVTIGLVALCFGVASTIYSVYESNPLVVLSLPVAVVLVAAIGWRMFLSIGRYARDPGLRAAARAERQRRLKEAIEESDILSDAELAERVAAEATEHAKVMDKAGLFAYPVRVVLGIALLAVAGQWSVDRLLEVWRSTPNVGVVVGYGSSQGFMLDGRLTIPGYHAVVEFETTREGKRTLVDWLGTRSPSIPVGQSVPVRFASETPSRATIDRGPWNWAPALAILFLGLLLVTHSSWKLFAILRRRSESRDPG